MMGVLRQPALEYRRQVERGHAVHFDANRVVLKDRHARHLVDPAIVIRGLPALALIGREHHHQLVDHFTQLVALVGELAVVRHTQHHVSQHARPQVVALPDEVAQVVVEGFVRRHPQHFQLQAQPFGELARQFHIDTAWLAILLVAVRREVLVHRHLEYAGLDDVIEGAHLDHIRLRQCAAQSQPQRQNQPDGVHHCLAASLSI